MATLEATFNPTDKSAPGHYGPSQTALLLLDFYTMFVEKAAGPKGRVALDIAVRMRTWAKAQGIAVIHCLLDASASPPATCKDADRFAGILAAMKASGAMESAELNEGGGDVTFETQPGHVSALKAPGLEEFLREKRIKSLVLVGLSTSGCVMRTAIAGTDAEFVVTVISDGCADPHDDLHDILVEKVLNHRGYVTTAAGFQEGFAKAADGK
jgi:nicotinamidase-related amidase